jgi:hypothetical protein
MWYLLIACLVAAALTWYCFSQRIERIQSQIERQESKGN